ncbi:MAG: hypothetical protein C4575_00750 [Desulforudis sp.]|nr:MAG: hypothetical protein C4575_00750 [Desulforudis sp.]
MKVWLTTPSELEPLRDASLELLKVIPRSNHLAIHWGMVMAVYPFWADVATQTGRLLRIQGSAAAAHVQRRVREQYGERETVSRAARRVLRSYLDWDVLEEIGEKGIYIAGTPLLIEDPRLTTLLLEASLRARGTDSATLKDLSDSPSLFPFQFEQFRAESLPATSSGLDIIRQGMDEDLVVLRK